MYYYSFVLFNYSVNFEANLTALRYTSQSKPKFIIKLEKKYQVRGKN